ncbi:MAG TPA: hypothetical protein VJ044_04815, partial [Candidatus Hodarchaeales archaeon]|nr:hypothetical protein [Candidatus Hodarchaeales archaeon]
MKALLVEDDSFFAQRVVEYLSDNGMATEVVKTTTEAIAAHIDKYDVAIIDVMLPNQADVSGITVEEARGGFFSGVALARKFREKTPAFPIIFLSADIAGGEARRWAKENNIPFVFKYEDRSRLLSALSDLGFVASAQRPRTFIVHGHDEIMLTE